MRTRTATIHFWPSRLLARSSHTDVSTRRWIIGLWSSERAVGGNDGSRIPSPFSHERIQLHDLSSVYRIVRIITKKYRLNLRLTHFCGDGLDPLSRSRHGNDRIPMPTA